MPENKEYMTYQEDMGSIQISEEVIALIASDAAMQTADITGLLNANMTDFMGGKKMTAKGVRIEMAEDGVVVNLFIMVRYGCTIGEVAKKTQHAVYTALENTTGFKIAAVNVHVGGISFNKDKD